MYLLRNLVDHVSIETALKSREIETAEALEARRSVHADDKAYEESHRRLFPGVPEVDAHAADMQAVPAAEVKTWHKRVWQPANATLLVVGKVNPAEAVALAEAWFGDWKAGTEPIRRCRLPPLSRQRSGRSSWCRPRAPWRQSTCAASSRGTSRAA